MAEDAPIALPGQSVTRRIGGGAPFVLLDDARGFGAAPARLLTDPVEIIVARTPDEVPALIAKIGEWADGGAHAAGYLSYEAGLTLEPRLAALARPLDKGWPLGWFARFATCQRIPAADVADLLPDPAGAFVGAPRPQIPYPAYAQAMEQVLDHIRAGDIYQANLTFNADVRINGDPLAIYARLRAHGSAGYGGVVFTGTHWLLSLSPELFFSLKDGRVMARPMKGTALRHPDPAVDAHAATMLANDAKQRAENLMIVDLIRNDLSRISNPGSVHVPALFRVETYPTIHQMVSDVTATMAEGAGIEALLRHIYPCGSITGAPKIRAMEIIHALEAAPRGAYTGSIGFIAPGGEAAFNVAIRTLALPPSEQDGALHGGDGCATVAGGDAILGLGSGIVADSDVAAEWQECLAKGEFIRVASGQFDLIETMAFDPLDGVLRLDAHLARLGESARALGFSFDRHAVRNMLQHASFHQQSPARIRVRLSPAGNVAVVFETPPATPSGPVPVKIVPLPVAPEDFRLRHKTSDRAFYDCARHSSGAFEIALLHPNGQLTEGSFTSLFVERDGLLMTPPLSLGLLPGILRAELIAQGKAVEAPLTPADLSDGFFIGNALRGLLPAIVVGETA